MHTRYSSKGLTAWVPAGMEDLLGGGGGAGARRLSAGCGREWPLKEGMVYSFSPRSALITH